MLKHNLLLAVAALVLASLAGPLGPLPAAEPPAKVEVEFWIVEVETTKLRALGFDWDALNRPRENQRSAEPPVCDPKFLAALAQNNLARIIAQPRLVTASGRPASLEIQPHLRLEVTPEASDEKHVKLDYEIEVARIGSKSTVHLELGRPACVSQTRSTRRLDNGTSAETALLVVVRATLPFAGR